MIRFILTDIEGTTSSISFVHEVLFPYARQNLARFVSEHEAEPRVQEVLAQVRELCENPDMSAAEVSEQLCQWIDEDRKITPLKTLQGYIWEAGFESGAYQGHVHADAVEQLRQWHAQGIQLGVYSSGSVHAQKLLFKYSCAGDLTPLFSANFDTRIGAKREPAAYAAIVEELGLPAQDILFLSDIVAELDAAKSIGLHTVRLTRPGETSAEDNPQQHPSAENFAQIQLPEV